MQGLQTFVGRRLTTILLLLLAGGFAMLLAELLLTSHVGGVQMVAPIAATLGLVAVIVGMVTSGGLRNGMAVLLLVLSLVGLVGTGVHYLNRGQEGPGAGMVPPGAQAAPDAAATAAPAAEAIAGDEAATAGDEADGVIPPDQFPQGQFPPGGPGGFGGGSTPPPLAPLSLSGLGLMGALVLLARREPA